MAFRELQSLESRSILPNALRLSVDSRWCLAMSSATLRSTLEHRQRQRMGQEQPRINYASIDPTNFIKISSQCCEDHFEFSFPLKQVKISDYNNRNRKGMVST